MTHRYEDLRELSKAALVAEYDALAPRTAVGLEWIRDELMRRDFEEQNQRMIDLTREVRTLTRWIAAMTLVNIVVVALTLAYTAWPMRGATETAMGANVDDIGNRTKLVSIKTDLRNIWTAQEWYLADSATYAPDWEHLEAKTKQSLSYGNSALLRGVTNGFTATVRNSSITAGFNECTVQVGARADSTIDGVIRCR